LGGENDDIDMHNIIVIYNRDTGAAIGLDVGGRMGHSDDDGRADNVFDPIRMWGGAGHEEFRDAMKKFLPEKVWEGKWDEPSK